LGKNAQGVFLGITDPGQGSPKANPNPMALDLDQDGEFPLGNGIRDTIQPAKFPRAALKP